MNRRDGKLSPAEAEQMAIILGRRQRHGQADGQQEVVGVAAPPASSIMSATCYRVGQATAGDWWRDLPQFRRFLK